LSNIKHARKFKAAGGILPAALNLSGLKPVENLSLPALQTVTMMVTGALI
jgi:hypothetical protein